MARENYFLTGAYPFPRPLMVNILRRMEGSLMLPARRRLRMWCMRGM